MLVICKIAQDKINNATVNSQNYARNLMPIRPDPLIIFVFYLFMKLSNIAKN